MRKFAYILLGAFVAVILLDFAFNAYGQATFRVWQGGTGSSTLVGILKGNGTAAIQTATPGVDYIDSSYYSSTTHPNISSLPSLSITESQISDLTHYTDSDVSSYLTGGTGITESSGTLSFDCSEVEGTGINCTGGEAIELDATGDWTGTLDSLEASQFLRSDTDDTMTGNLTITGNSTTTTLEATTKVTAPIFEATSTIQASTLNLMAIATSSNNSGYEFTINGDMEILREDTGEQVFTASASSNGLNWNLLNSNGRYIFDVNSTERMRLSGSNLGIGTNVPDVQLHVQDGNTAITELSNTNALFSNVSATTDDVRVGLIAGNQGETYLDFGDTDDLDVGGIVYDNMNNDMGFLTNSGERVTLGSSGNIGIGSSTPWNYFNIQNVGSLDSFYVADITGDDSVVRIDNSGNLGIGMTQTESIDSILEIRNGSDDFVRMTRGGVGTWYMGVGGTANYKIVDADNSTEYLTIIDGNDTGGGNIGISTTTPYAKLSVVGETVAEYFTGTSTTASNSFAGKVGIGNTTPTDKLDITVADSSNYRGLAVTQSDTTNNPEAARITQNAAENGLVVDCNADAGNSTSVGGCIFNDNTGNIGAGYVGYTNAGATADGRLMVLRADNADFNQQVLFLQNDGLNGAFFSDCNNQNMTNNCGVIDSEATSTTALGITSPVLAQGVIKATHEYSSGDDSGASALSLLLGGTGTAAQGIFLDSSVWTTGKLVNIRQAGNEIFVLNADGGFTMASTTATSTIAGNLEVQTALELPNGTGVSIDGAGKIALDTTDNQLIYDDGDNEHVVPDTFEKSFWLASTTQDASYNSFSSATTSFELFHPSGATTLEAFYCDTDTGTVAVRAGDGTNYTGYLVADSDGEEDFSPSNNTFTDRETFEVEVGSQTGSTNKVTCTFTFSEDRQ